MSDKRFLKRKKSIFYLKVEDYVSGKEIGRLVDITDLGFRIITGSSVATGKELVLTIELPEAFEGREQILFKATCMYNTKDVNPDYYSAGFQFKDITVGERNVIFWLSKNYIFQE